MRCARLVALAALLVVGCAHPRGADPAPRARGYAVPADVERLLVDDAAFAALVRAVRPDVEADVALGVAAAGWSTWRDRMFDLALLDSLDGNWELAVLTSTSSRARRRTPRRRS